MVGLLADDYKNSLITLAHMSDLPSTSAKKGVQDDEDRPLLGAFFKH